MNKKINLYLIIALVYVGCSSPEKALNTKPSLSNTNTALQQSINKELMIRPLYEVYHINDSVSELHFRINSNGLLYTKRESETFTSNCIISYQLFNSLKTGYITDSASVKLVDSVNYNSNKYLTGKLLIKAPIGIQGYIKITVLDNNRNYKANTIIDFDKLNSYSRQNYLLTIDNKLIFRNYLKTKEVARIKYTKVNTNIIKVSYYNRTNPLPLPPFSTKDTSKFNFTPDSIFYINKENLESFEIQPQQRGIYHIQADTSNKEGITIFVFENNYFPEIKKTQDMLLSLRYICSKEEYDNMEVSSNRKLSIETFWMNTVNNEKEKARITICKYYSRVQSANENFTSITEGWKTDRGMIYIVLGKPNSIYKTESYETWVYNEDRSTGSITLTFEKINSPFTNNHYLLDRSGLYRQPWLLAVDVWRSGRAYLLDE